VADRRQSVANGVTLTAIGTLVDGGTIANAGSINGAVEVYTGAIFANLAGGNIYSPVDAVLFEGPSTFTNSGNIASVYAPLQFDQAGTFSNAASGVVTLTGTGGLGVQLDAGGRVDNAGLIINPGNGYAIHFNGAGTSPTRQAPPSPRISSPSASAAPAALTTPGPSPAASASSSMPAAASPTGPPGSSRAASTTASKSSPPAASATAAPATPPSISSSAAASPIRAASPAPTTPSMPTGRSPP
jgi:hypothetical protein